MTIQLTFHYSVRQFENDYPIEGRMFRQAKGVDHDDIQAAIDELAQECSTYNEFLTVHNVTFTQSGRNALRNGNFKTNYKF